MYFDVFCILATFYVEMAIQKKQLTMKKIVLIISILVFNMYVSFGATLPSESYSAAISQDDPVTITPSMEMGGRVSASNTVLGDQVSGCEDDCRATFESDLLDCGGDPECMDQAEQKQYSCIQACESGPSLPVGSGLSFLLLLSGAYGVRKFAKQNKV